MLVMPPFIDAEVMLQYFPTFSRLAIAEKALHWRWRRASSEQRRAALSRSLRRHCSSPSTAFFVAAMMRIVDCCRLRRRR